MTPAFRQAESRHHLGGRDYVVVAAMNLLWGLNIIATKYVVAATGPFMAAAVRFGVLGLICLPWLRIRKGKMVLLVLLGMFNGGLFLFFMNLALKVATNVGALAIAGQLSVPISVLMGVVFLKERMSRPQIAGLLLAFAGVALIVFDPRIVDEIPGMMLMVAAATCFATGSLLQRRLAGVPVLTIYAWTGLVGFTMLLPISLLAEPNAVSLVRHMTWHTVGWFAFSVLGSTLMGQGGMTWLLSRHPVSAIMPLTLFATVISVFASHFMLGTATTNLVILGGITTLLGTLLLSVIGAQARGTE